MLSMYEEEIASHDKHSHYILPLNFGVLLQLQLHNERHSLTDVVDSS